MPQNPFASITLYSILQAVPQDVTARAEYVSLPQRSFIGPLVKAVVLTGNGPLAMQKKRTSGLRTYTILAFVLPLLVTTTQRRRADAISSAKAQIV